MLIVEKETSFINQIVDQQIAERLRQRRSEAQLVRVKRRQQRLQQVITLAKTRPFITNHHICDLLHVSQSTATSYLSELTRQGLLTMARHSRSTIYKVTRNK